MKKNFTFLLFALLSFAKAYSADYYTSSTSATINGATSANWTTNSDGTSGLGTVALTSADNLFILSGANVTVTANTTVRDFTVAGGANTTLVTGAGLKITLTGGLSGTCVRTGSGSFVMSGGTLAAPNTISYQDAAGSSAPTTASTLTNFFTNISGSTLYGVGLSISAGANISLAGPTTIYGVFFAITTGTLNLNGQTLNTSCFVNYTAAPSITAVPTNLVVSASNADLVIQNRSGFDLTSRIVFVQTTPGTTNKLNSLTFFSDNPAKITTCDFVNSAVIKDITYGANAANGNVKTNAGNCSITLTGNLIYNGNSIGVSSAGTGSKFLFASTSTINFPNETNKAIRTIATSNIEIEDGATLKINAFFVAPTSATTYSLCTLTPITKGTNGFTLVLPTGYTGNLAYTANTMDLNILTTLPLNLLNFTGKYDNGKALLKWNTADEKNTDYFSIERSTDGTIFNSVGKLKTVGKGNASYSFIDQAPASGNNYYRLRTVDNDGSFDLSKIISLKTESLQTSVLSIYPNPVAGLSLTVNHNAFKGKAIISIYNLGGALIKNIDVTVNSNQTLIDTSMLNPGNYILKLQNNDGAKTIKFIKN
jgi:hypothetical protein